MNSLKNTLNTTKYFSSDWQKLRKKKISKSHVLELTITISKSKLDSLNGSYQLISLLTN